MGYFGFCWLLNLHLLQMVFSDPSPPSNPSCGSLNSAKISNGGMVCIPNTCDYDSCVPNLGKCNGTYGSYGYCLYQSGNYSGVLSYPYGVSTEYCQIEASGGCDGGSCGDKVSESFIKSWNVEGIAAVNPILFGLDQNRNNKLWGQGCTHNSNVCYYLEAKGGSANVMITDRCAGYCKFNANTFKCDPNGTLNEDCGVCVEITQNPQNIKPNCPCLGTDGDMYPECCGQGCQMPLDGACDWCSGNDHPHFDLDLTTFNHICGSDAPMGHCILKTVLPYECHQNSQL